MFIDEFMDFCFHADFRPHQQHIHWRFQLTCSDPNDTNSAIFNDTIEAMVLCNMWVNLHTSRATR